ncbi:MAG: cytochrome c [Lysobacterales bacterium]
MNFTRLLLALGLLFGFDSAFAQTEPAADPAALPDAAATIKAALAEVAAAQPGNAEAGAAKAAVCGACHGLDGNSADPQYPKLAGQHEAYSARQLALFKAQVRQNPLMFGMSMTLSAQDMRDVSAWFASQAVVPGLASEARIADRYSPYVDQRLVDVGQSIFRAGVAQRGIPACMSCHGPDGRGNAAAGYPALAGQHSTYSAAALARYRGVPPGDAMLNVANVAIMVSIAQRLSDEEATAVASYIEGLHAREGAATGLAASAH